MTNVNLKEKLEKKELLSLFQSGCKPSDSLKVGMEYERPAINTKTFKSVDYNGKKGMCEFLRNFAKVDNWDYLIDDYNIIGLKKLHNAITLEPGCQLELSLKPQKKIIDLKTEITKLNNKMQPLLEQFGITLLDYGIAPLSTYRNINIIPKSRYGVMANYFWGILSDVMMRETAGIQACFDFENEEDAIKKFKIANMLSPFATAIFANSPIRGGVETGYKTFRALSWLNTDNDRCGICGQIENNFGFEKYIDAVLDTPLIYIVRDYKIIKIKGRLKFKEFILKGYEGYEANIDDFKLHANLYFPDVRLRKFIEIRNQDCVNRGMQYSILAFYKGILYNNEAMDAVEKLLSDFGYEDLNELRYDVPKYALDAKICEFQVRDIAKELMKISEKSLKSMNGNEEKLLEPILEYTMAGICPADIILLNWNGLWNKDLKKLIRYLNAV